MSKIKTVLKTSDISPTDYCTFGLATCFIREEGEVHQVKIVEPIPSAALEAILQGVPTSYEFICARELGDLSDRDTLSVDREFPPESQLCDRFFERTVAATRTFKSRPEARQHIPVGTIKKDLNYSLDKKRVLNNSKVVRVEDNVKQHEYTHKVL